MCESISEIVDQLIIVNLKIYHLIEVVEGESDDRAVANAARKIQRLNRQRSLLKNELNRRWGDQGEEVKV